MVHIHQIRVGPSWMDSIVLFLKEDVLPDDKFEAYKVRRKAPQFWLFEDQMLYERSFFGPYLLFIPLLLIPFRSGRNDRNFSYRYANRYQNTPFPPRVKFQEVSGHFSHSGQFQPRCKFQPEQDLAYYLKKRKKKNSKGPKYLQKILRR